MKTLWSIESIVQCGMIVFATATLSHGADLSPAGWPKAERERLEKLESQTWSPLKAESFEGHGGMVSATVSPLAVFAGIQALKLGGNAADTAAATALTQITTQLGSVVSYAGLFTMVYYDAKTHKVYSMDAGYNSYLKETDSKTIPVSDLGPLAESLRPNRPKGAIKGRETLVPGFMAGVEAMHGRFGRLPFRDLFQPALWYAEHGVRISPILQWLFHPSSKGAVPHAGRSAVHAQEGGGEMPKAGDLFLQADLGKTLKAVGEHGSRYMYTGPVGSRLREDRPARRRAK